MQLQDDHSHEPVGTEAIQEEIIKFLSTLHNTTQNKDPPDLLSYFDSVQLLWLEEGHRIFLDEPFTAREVIQLINAMPGDKAPGLDDLSAAFYKEYTQILALHLFAMFEESLVAGALPHTLRY
ncbi:hypothetical protein NDU88_004575 [Pleurodeles waltl]|uniref:Uncharacterized protein n=1 Tax=Pleurodeles waltl TaxID=8319 RepID=A0AAV7WWA5_PLEWA|nr:hypothetical protein NDU88_004575 [Pleurodeles waltl]